MKRQSQYPGLHEHHCPYWSCRITVTWSHRKKNPQCPNDLDNTFISSSIQYWLVLGWADISCSQNVAIDMMLSFWWKKKRPERKAKKRGKQCLRLTKSKKIVWSCQKHFQMSRNGERNVSRRNKRREIHILQRKTRNIKWIKNHIHNLYNVFVSCFFLMRFLSKC